MPPSKVRRLVFPVGGLDKSQAYQHQRPFTTPDCSNVWPESQDERRERGGSRPGLAKAISTQVNGSNAVNLMADISYITQNQTQARALVVAAGGTLKFTQNLTSWTSIGSPLTLNSSILLSSASYLQKLYIADYSPNPLGAEDGETDSGGTQFTSTTYANWLTDGSEVPNANDYVLVIRDVGGDTTHEDVGTHVIDSFTTVSTTNDTLVLDTAITGSLTDVNFYVERCPKVYSPIAFSLTRWRVSGYGTANARGQVPVGNPLACAWGDRVVLAGGHDAPNMWHMSKMGDAHDWVTTDPTMTTGVNGLSDDLGQIGEPITALIPWQDQVLLIASENELWAIRGNPAAGGTMVNLSYEHGILRGKAWARTDTGELIFLSKNGLFGMQDPSGSAPYPISRERLPEELLFTDDSTKRILLEYDKLNRKVLIFIV